MDTTTQRRCCFGTEFTRRFLTCDAWNPFTGPRWNVNKLRWQLVTDTILSAVIFILTEVGTALEAEYWRPIKWSIYWIVLSLICMTVGITGAVKRSPGFLIAFIVLMVMFCAINMAHVNQMRGELIRSCKLSQRSFKGCDPATNTLAAQYLSNCTTNDSCENSDLDKTDCEAVSATHCSDKDSMESMFWMNEVINFFSYAEPVFFALLLLIRAEFTGDTCPNPPKEEHEYPHESFELGNPAIFYHEDEEQLYYGVDGSSSEREPFVLRPEVKAEGDAARDTAATDSQQAHGDAA